MIWLGTVILGLGIVLVLLPLTVSVALCGLLIIGLGCAPIYPTIIHETPTNFGAEKSQAVIGIQMAFAYIARLLRRRCLGYWQGQSTSGCIHFICLASC